MKKHRLKIIAANILIILTSTSLGVSAKDSGDVEYHGYVEIPHSVESVRGEVDILSGEETLPEYYDAREQGVVTSVKDQDPWGSCWSFSSMAALESDLLSQGLYDDMDLSEYHLVNYCYQWVEDPLGGTAEDSFSYSGSIDSFLNAGGNILVAYHALTNWMGAVAEAAAEYPLATPMTLPATTESAYLNDLIHLQQFYVINKDDMADVKKAIMEHGGVTAAIYYKAMYLNEENGAFFNSYYQNSNHAVTIVGWDDTYSKENFTITPDTDGAWLVKNSWGTDFGLDGYLWVSYEDRSLQDEICVLVGETADNYDNNYQYDGSYMNKYVTYSSPVNVANIFKVKSKDTKEKLRAVAFELGNTNVNYSIQIYKNPTDETNPVSGMALLEKPVMGKTVYEGYYTVKLPEEILLEPGDVFAVVITFQKKTGVKVVYENTYTWNSINFVAGAKEKQSLVLRENDDTWEDVGISQSVNLRIKAFTDNVEVPEENPFSDVAQDAWYYEAAKYVNGKGIMTGVGTDEQGKIVFLPLENIPREQFVTALWKKEQVGELAFADRFADIPKEQYYTSAVLWGAENNIVKGIADDLFGTGQNVTREQLATLLYRYAMYKEYDTGARTDISYFPDADEISEEWALDGLEWAVATGIMVGKLGSENQGNILDPQGYVTRSECAMMLQRFMEWYE